MIWIFNVIFYTVTNPWPVFCDRFFMTFLGVADKPAIASLDIARAVSKPANESDI